ncbi:MAG: hypothetical protein KDA71_04220, partial [Planctomycetales bacterium]|nr:hypothetical protein [Planctomycetales bacterium]
MRWSLAFVPSPFKSVGNYLSLDGQRLFTCISGQRFQLLLLDGSPWALVPKSPRRFRAGPDLGMLVAILGDEGDQTIRVNDDLFGPFDTIDLPAWPNFAAAPKSIAFRFVRRGKVWMHVDGFEFGPYDDADTPTLLDDSAVYRFRRGNEHYVFANGEEYGPFDHIDTRVVAHGGRLAFVAGHGGKSQLWLDGQPTGEYCRRADVAFSDDGQRTAIVYRRND